MGRFTLALNSRHQLVYTDDEGRSVVDVEVVRAFPLTDPGHSISICDSQGRELLFLEGLDNVDTETRAAIEIELAQREFVPVILRITNTPSATEPATWQVETDRGTTAFEVESDEAIHRQDSFRVSITDTHGVRYEIPDVRKLDARSRKALERFL